MHDLPYPDNHFDIVILGWVLAYSNNNELAVSEIMRVAKKKAFIAIGCAYRTVSGKSENKTMQGTDIDPTRFSCVEDITNLFKDRLDKIFFYGEPDTETDKSKGAKQITVVFRLK